MRKYEKKKLISEKKAVSDGKGITAHEDGSTEVDFNQLALNVGYVKARQLRLKASLQSHQSQIEKADEQVMKKTRQTRIDYFCKLSATMGQPNIDSPVEKVMNNPLSIEAKRPITSTTDFDFKNPTSNTDTSMTTDRESIIRLALLRSYKTEELILPQMEMPTWPGECGDTLFLQVSHLKRMNCPRNKITSFLAYDIPQLSLRHLRYLQDLNLSGNKVNKLPSQLSCLHSLTKLDISNNSISKIPDNINCLTKLVDLNCSGNNISDLTREMVALTSLTCLNLSKNIFTAIPSVIYKLHHLTSLDISFNSIFQAGIQPVLMKPQDMWHPFTNPETGVATNINIFTHERIKDVTKYNGAGIRRATYLHTFQPMHSERYKTRRLWLSVCQVNEWDPVVETTTGYVYYSNNVSGDTQWEMPEGMDLLGHCEELVTLNLSHNVIRTVPKSLDTLKRLKKLLLNQNKIGQLPHELGQLKSLETLRAEDNELRYLPYSLSYSTTLVELCVSGNLLETLPDGLGAVPTLKRLAVTANKLKKLPYSLGFCKTLTELQAYENPLEDPPYQVMEQGMPHVLWYLRQQHWIEQRGMPPEMKFRVLGIGEEIVMIEPEYKTTLTRLIEKGKADATLNLQMLGLREIPEEVLAMTALKELRLDNNVNVGTNLSFPMGLSTLRLLSLRACNLTEIPGTLSNLRRLHTFNVSQNLLEFLPSSMSRMNALKDLDLSRNRLYSLPDGFRNLSQLETLNMEDNNIEDLPAEIGSLKRLTVLNAGKNRIQMIPKEFSGLERLKTLIVERNSIIDVPIGFRDLQLVELRLGYNRIEWLPDDLFAGQLGKTVELVSLQENLLVDLPSSVSNLKCLQGLKEGYLSSLSCKLVCDFNPMTSPPIPLRSEGLEVVQKYMRIRNFRIDEMFDLLKAEDFVFLKENATPTAYEVIEDGSGFLFPDDLEQFDQAVDKYINGPLYLCPASGEEMVNTLVQLRNEREIQMYSLILNAMLKAIESVQDDERFGLAVLTSTKRKWGRDQESVQCWVISLEALLNTTPPNILLKLGREAILEIINRDLPVTPFPFNADLLKDALRYHMSPYGQVADIDQFSFKQCDCVDSHLRPMDHKPCVKSAVIVCKIIYSREEARRRLAEEQAYNERFEDIEDAVLLWIQSKFGQKALKALIVNRKKELSKEIKLRQEICLREEVKLKRCKTEQQNIQKRKQMYEQGIAFELHMIKSPQDAIKLIIVADNKVQHQLTRTMTMKESLEELKVQAQRSDEEFKAIAADELVQKYCKMARDKMLHEFRVSAFQDKLRRPWDGELESDFLQWIATVGKRFKDAKRDENNAVAAKALVATSLGKEGNKDDDNESESGNGTIDNLLDNLEFDWLNCENMAAFHCAEWDFYRLSHESCVEKVKNGAIVMSAPV